MDEEISYHSSRALAELDRARRCPGQKAARCHLDLAEKHLDRMRALARAAAASDPAQTRAGLGSVLDCELVRPPARA